MSHHYTEIFYWISNYGLCNRIRLLTTYQALAELLKVPLYVYWEPNWSCPEEVYNLYDTSSLNLINKEKAEQICQEQKEDRLVFVLKPRNITGASTPHRVWESFASDIISWEEFKKLSLKHLHALVPLPYLKEKIERFADRFGIQNTIGVHVRLTDNVINARFRKGMGKPPPTIYSYQKVMDNYIKEDETVRFLLASDNIKSEKQMKKRYGKRIIAFEKEYKTQDILNDVYRQTSVQDALVDLYLLSKTRKIITDPTSTFGKMAALIGNIKWEAVRRTRLPPTKLLVSLFVTQIRCKRMWRKFLYHLRRLFYNSKGLTGIF